MEGNEAHLIKLKTEDIIKILNGYKIHWKWEYNLVQNAVPFKIMDLYQVTSLEMMSVHLQFILTSHLPHKKLLAYSLSDKQCL